MDEKMKGGRGMIIRILHKLGIVRGIWLEDYKGKVYITIKHTNPFRGHWAYVYPFTKTGHVSLKEDGTCEGMSSYIMRWKDF